LAGLRYLFMASFVRASYLKVLAVIRKVSDPNLWRVLWHGNAKSVGWFKKFFERYSV